MRALRLFAVVVVGLVGACTRAEPSPELAAKPIREAVAPAPAAVVENLEPSAVAAGNAAPSAAAAGSAGAVAKAAPSPSVEGPRTALLVVQLHADGRLKIEAVSPREFPYRRAGVPIEAAPTGRAGVGAGLLKSAVGPGSFQAPASATDPGAGLILVEHEGRAQPFGVPISLGQPGEGGGDVADRWQDGSVILRAPHFGPGTRFSLFYEGRLWDEEVLR